jgi:Biotin/lipoate A/B protein ligase family
VPNQAGTRARASSAPALDLPPPFRLVTLREVGDAFAHAIEVAADEGAGTLVHVGRFDLAEFAVVLEPDEPLRTARRTFYVGMQALGDALLVHAPPERPITFAWPDVVHVDGGMVGGARLAWPPHAKEDETPDWLVFGAIIRTVSMGAGDAGLRPLVSALEEEGFDDVGAGLLVESFARHLMLAIDAWQSDGFATIADSYLRRVNRQKGALHALAENGDLLEKWKGQAEPDRRSLQSALAVPSWLDPATGGPR